MGRKGEFEARSTIFFPVACKSPRFYAPVRPDRASVVCRIGLDSTVYGTHTMRRAKATLIYERTKNLRAV